MMKKLLQIFIACIVSTIVSASVSQKIDDSFFQNDFQEIIRFEMLRFNEKGVLDAKSVKTLDAAIKRAKEIQKSFKVKITLVGHSYKAADYYPKKIKNSLTYASDVNITDDKSVTYVEKIQKQLIDKGVEKNLVYVYSKRGKVLAFSDETPANALLSNRVMLSIYVLRPEDIDSDGDGVSDKYDRCSDTPRGSKVDKNGCPADSDHDGVVDYKDKCENTPSGINVDFNGCPLKQTLKLYFKSNSDKILKNGYKMLERFAEFLKKNPGYKVKVIGHTDNIGKAVVNMAFSLKQAEFVKKALIAKGIDASRIVATGRGELDPIASNKTEEGRRVNRRIEIKLFH
jgi:outer membrane protein OmpA-like peptidoglycan-associated protein